MKFANKEILKNWAVPGNYNKIYNEMFVYSPDDYKGTDTLEVKFNSLSLADITGEPSRCHTALRGPKKGFQVFYDNTTRLHYTAMEVVLGVLKGDFGKFVTTVLSDFFYDGPTVLPTYDLQESIINLVSLNMQEIGQYRYISDPELKELVHRAPAIQTILIAIYSTALSCNWALQPTKHTNPVSRLSAQGLSKVTNISLTETRNILALLKTFHAIQEVSIEGMSEAYISKYINRNQPYMHQAVYLLFPLNEVDWSLANQLQLTSHSRISQASVRYFLGDEVCTLAFGDKDTSNQLPIMHQFGATIEELQSQGATSVTQKALFDTVLGNTEGINESTLKGTWQSFALFLPMIGIQVVTASVAKKQGLQTEASGRQKVLLIG